MYRDSTLEHTVLFSVVTAVVCAIAVLILSGCTVQQQHPGQQVTAAKLTAAADRPTVQPAPAPTPAPVPQPTPAPTPPPAPELLQPVYQPPPPPLPRPQRIYPTVEPMAAGGKTITFRPGEKPVLSCAETATLTIKFPAGERIINYGVGASAEWILKRETMGIDLPIGAITVGRTPFSRKAEMHVLTDSDVYQFILNPITGGVSQNQPTLFQVVNMETEARRAEQQQRRMEVAEMERRERQVTAPQLDPAHRRSYQVGGDHVPWMPVNVEGDNRQTVIELPRSTGTALPTLTVIEYGKEMRVNTRPLPEGDGKGPRLVVDQPFAEARLIGDGGTVSIISTH